MDITIADRCLDFEIRRTLNKILSEPRTSLTIRFCRELRTTLRIKQEQQDLEAIKARIQASRRQIAKVIQQRRRMATAVRSFRHGQFGTLSPFPGQDETKAGEDKPSACSGMNSLSTVPSSPGANLQARPPTTKAIETESSDTEPGDHKHQILHSTNIEKKQHIVCDGAEPPQKYTNAASAVSGHIIGNATLQAQSEFASIPTHHHPIQNTNSQPEEADLIERRMLSDEKETRIATTESNLGGKRAAPSDQGGKRS